MVIDLYPLVKILHFSMNLMPLVTFLCMGSMFPLVLNNNFGKLSTEIAILISPYYKLKVHETTVNRLINGF